MRILAVALLAASIAAAHCGEPPDGGRGAIPVDDLQEKLDEQQRKLQELRPRDESAPIAVPREMPQHPKTREFLDALRGAERGGPYSWRENHIRRWLGREYRDGNGAMPKKISNRGGW